MTLPIEVKIDIEANASYVRYRRLLPGEQVSETVDIVDDGSVAADLDSVKSVIGIEVLGFDEETLMKATQFAIAQDLMFPLGSLMGAGNDTSSTFCFVAQQSMGAAGALLMGVQRHGESIQVAIEDTVLGTGILGKRV